MIIILIICAILDQKLFLLSANLFWVLKPWHVVYTCDSSLSIKLNINKQINNMQIWINK